MMQRPSAVAVIDIGKTNVKLALVDLETMREIEVVSQPNEVLEQAPYPHFDADKIWNFIIASITGFSKTYEISAITTTTHGACCALLDENNELVTPILDYEFDGPDALSKAYDELRPAFEETGSPRLPGGLNIGAQLFWLFQTQPDLKARTKHIVTYAQYWTARLTGVVVNEFTSLGCHTDLWNPKAAKYSSFVEKAGWLELMAPVEKANSLIGVLKPELAAEMGLKPNTRVHCGIHDSNASLYPHLFKRQSPFCVVSTGTWVISMAIGSSSIKLDPKRDTLMNVNGLCEPVPSARFMGGREFETLMQGRTQEYIQEDKASVLNKMLMLLPSIVTNSGPYPDKISKWLNREGELTNGEYFIVVSYYLALMTASCLELIESAGSIIVEGPFANNAHYCEMLQASTGQLVVPFVGTGTSIGAALLTLEHNNKEVVEEEMSFSAEQALTAYARHWKKIVSQENADTE
ncbi:MAG: FGGY-family carbohydrate kinase [Nitratireductor sp.]